MDKRVGCLNMYFNKYNGVVSNVRFTHTMVEIGQEWPVYAGGRYCGYVSYGKFKYVKAPRGKLVFDCRTGVVNYGVGMCIDHRCYPIFGKCGYLGYVLGDEINV
jgi:hypothetical protein